MPCLNIYFCGPSNTWGVSNIRENEYFLSLSKYFVLEISHPSKAQFFFVNETFESIAEYFRYSRKGAISILISGEAMSPDFNIFDYAVGFDPINYTDRYLRFAPGYRFRKFLSLKPTQEIKFQDRKFCDFIYSNPFANAARDELKNLLDRISRVDSYGIHLNNTGVKKISSHHSINWRQEKTEIHSNYKFSIAAENAFHLGYTSEKVFSAIAAGSIPVCWGNPLIELDVNPKRIINIHKFDSELKIISFINEINNSERLFLDITHESWFTQDQQLLLDNYSLNLENFLLNIFSSEKASRRSNGTYSDRYYFIHTMGFGIRKRLFNAFYFVLKKFEIFLKKEILILRRAKK